MCPCWFPRPVGRVETASLDVPVRAGVHQIDRALAGLATAVEPAIGGDDRPFTRLPLAPHDLAGFHLDAGQDARFPGEVQVSAHLDDAAVVVLQVWAEICF